MSIMFHGSIYFSPIISSFVAFSLTATRVSTVATAARMEAGDHSDVLVCASEYIADRLYFVTLKGGRRNSYTRLEYLKLGLML